MKRPNHPDFYISPEAWYQCSDAERQRLQDQMSLNWYHRFGEQMSDEQWVEMLTKR